MFQYAMLVVVQHADWRSVPVQLSDETQNGKAATLHPNPGSYSYGPKSAYTNVLRTLGQSAYTNLLRTLGLAASRERVSE